MRGHVAPQSCPAPRGWSRGDTWRPRSCRRGDTWRPRSCPEPEGGSLSRGDTRRPQSCPKSKGRSRSRGDTWLPRSCPDPRGGSRSRGDTWRPRSCPAPGAGAQEIHDASGAALSQEVGTTPPSPLPRPSVGGQVVVVPVTPPDNPHRMITRAKTGFRVVPDCLVLTAVTSSPTPSPIPSSAPAALADPH
jgi:hypothetical protein